jgi:hypothetical protein
VNKAKAILELVYYATGPLLALAAFIGLRQLRLAKAAMTLSAKREAYRLTADQLKQYYVEIIPRINMLHRAIEDKKLTNLNTATFSIRKEEIEVHTPKSGMNDILQVAAEFAEVFNSLEAFAVFFTSGVASEEVAFSSLHSTYCNTVREFLPYVVTVGTDQAYQHVLKLFLLWNSREKKLELVKDKSRIDQRLAGMPERKIVPLGLD